MEKFIVSARKYRPQNFNTVVGQSHITTTLKNAIRNEQLAHAFLFCGPRGVGKTTCARILAKTINCENRDGDGEACNVCNSCVSFNEGASLNIHELDAASNNSVDDIRVLVDQVRFAPQAGKYKVYIIDEVHMLSASAFNAFLKTLEEPPSYAIFILATTEKHKILPTILSRCQIFDFKRITNNDTVEHLQEIVGKEEIQAEKAALQLIAQKSEGCMRDSLSILDKIVSFTNGEVTYKNTLEHLNILDHDYYFSMLDSQLNEDMAGSMLLFDEINRKGFEGDLVINGYAEFLRNLLVSQNPKAASLLDVVEGLQSKYIEASAKVNAAYLVSALNILNDAEINYKMARNKRLHVEMALIKLTFLKQAIDLIFDNETGSIVKKKRASGPIAVRYQPLQSLQMKPGKSTVAKPPVQESKLFVQPKKQETIVSESIPAFENKPASEEVRSAASIPIAKSITPKVPTSKKSLLDSVRDQVFSTKATDSDTQIVPISYDAVMEVWTRYKEQLKTENKPSTATAFHQSTLEIINDSFFTVTVGTSFEQKFIDQEKMTVLELMKIQFQNRSLDFAIEVVEKPNDDEPLEEHLSTKAKFDKIVEQYPMVKVLKDRLKLDLE